ncbi:uncharacterized protein LOC114941685 [Nylanderia fulva]|uniref:uncharacterized protein LOC114941685 n=1 Tax=Nylanderia fulva TaxID=613905 RepID=UPI0010FB2C51|nr:uncharacterized protein LOC114941685 [Nylanderia fulva]XP_029172579.1 uncharacterized protein LOC114941685 [Nylanderia fulva]
MNFALALFAVLAVIGLGQTHQFPSFGKGPLHEDIQDILDLVPAKDINEVFLDYYADDSEVKAAFDYLVSTTIIKDLMIDFEAIPEVINLFNYLYKEGVDIYYLINEVNKALDIKELEPPSHVHSTIMKKTGAGIAGLFKDINKVLPFEDFIHIYVQKIKTSPAFVSFVNQLKSDNFQQIVNQFYDINSIQTIHTFLKSKDVNTQIVADIMYIVLGITVPNNLDYVHVIL